MAFANALALLWVLLAVPIVVFYLWRVGLPQEPVATDMLWQRALAEQRGRSAWQRWRWPASLAVQLALLALMVAALADPQIPGPRRIVLIIDNSASMGATDVGPTRLAGAKQAAERLIAGLRGCDQMAILSAGDVVGVCAGATNDQTTLRDALHEVDVPAGGRSTQVPAAVELARRMLAEGRRGKIVVVTDGCFNEAEGLAKADDVKLIRVGKGAGNVAITRLAARRNRTDPTRCQVLAEVHNFSGQSVECTVKIETMTGGTAESMPVRLAPDGGWRKIIEITAPEAGRISLKLDHRDVYAKDDGVSLMIPAPTEGDTVVVRPIESVADRGLPRAGLSGHSEGDLRVRGNVGMEATEVTPPRLGPPPWVLLAGLGALLLALEWCFYQRRWVC